ncbi:MAG: hypothetical protein V4629_02405 [Pseudomonadota bacterium]
MQQFIPKTSSEVIQEIELPTQPIIMLDTWYMPEVWMPMVDLSPDRTSEWCGGFIKWTISDDSIVLDSKKFRVLVGEVWKKIRDWLIEIHPINPCLYLYMTSPDGLEDNIIRNVSQQESRSRDYRRQLIKIFQHLATDEQIQLFWVISANGFSLVDAVSISNVTPCIRFSEALLERPQIMESELIQRACWWIDQPDSTETWWAWRRFQRRMLIANIQPNAVLINVMEGRQIGRWFSTGVRCFAGTWPHVDSNSFPAFVSYFEPHEVLPF